MLWCLLAGGGVEKVKEKRSTIRVEKYFQFLAIGSNGEGGTKAFIHYYDDPKGEIFSSLSFTYKW